MPSDHARIRRDIWADTDWRQLSVRAQWLYMHLLSTPTLSLCGVADWRPARISALAADASADMVVQTSAELIEARFVLPDFDTEEVCIRSWVKHDGLLANGNMSTAMRSAWDATASEAIRGLIVDQLRRRYDADPSLVGWDRVGDLLDKPSMSFVEALAQVMPDASVSPSGSNIEAPSQAPRQALRQALREAASECVDKGVRNAS